MKSKILIIIMVIVLFSYIVLSTHFIDEDSYRNIAHEYTKNDKTVIGRSGSKVEVVKLDKHAVLFQGHEKDIFYYSCKINRNLLKLNGSYAVRVTMKTTNNFTSGPRTIYINPFTKGIIGLDIRI